MGGGGGGGRGAEAEQWTDCWLLNIKFSNSTGFFMGHDKSQVHSARREVNLSPVPPPLRPAMSEWLKTNLYMAHTKILHKTLRVGSASLACFASC